MQKFVLTCLFFLGSCVEGPSVSVLSQRQESSCHVMRVPKGWKVHSVGGDGSVAVLTKARIVDKPTSYMVVGAYGHCYNVYEEQQ